MHGKISAALIFVMVSIVRAADLPRDLSPTLKPFVDRYHLPGMIGAIVHGDRIIALGSTGVRRLGDPTPFLTTDLIHLGSDTKAMTAILIGQLIDKGQLHFDSTMAEIFPDLSPQMDPQMAKNTVRNLLDHNAGFPHDLDWWAISRSNLPMIQRRRMAVQQALSAAPATPVGKFSYSNVSFVVLGAIVESKTGRMWEDVIRQEVFVPLHMQTAGFGVPGNWDDVDEPWGHLVNDGKLKPVQTDNAPVLGPAGTVHCSMTDWCRFAAETLHGLQGHPTLVSANTFKQLTTPKSGQDYAGGWIVTTRPWADGPALTHSGSNTTWFCTVWIAPKKDFAVLVAVNDGADPVAKATDEAIGALIQFNEKIKP